MNGRQKERTRRAVVTVDRLVDEAVPPERVLTFLRDVARDPRNIHYTPHLITAIRDAGYWPALQSVDISR